MKAKKGEPVAERQMMSRSWGTEKLRRGMSQNTLGCMYGNIITITKPAVRHYGALTKTNKQQITSLQSIVLKVIFAWVELAQGHHCEKGEQVAL